MPEAVCFKTFHSMWYVNNIKSYYNKVKKIQAWWRNHPTIQWYSLILKQILKISINLKLCFLFTHHQSRYTEWQQTYQLYRPIKLKKIHSKWESIYIFFHFIKVKFLKEKKISTLLWKVYHSQKWSLFIITQGFE